LSAGFLKQIQQILLFSFWMYVWLWMLAVCWLRRIWAWLIAAACGFLRQLVACGSLRQLVGLAAACGVRQLVGLAAARGALRQLPQLVACGFVIGARPYFVVSVLRLMGYPAIPG
jgi:hypothetical protein